MSGEYKRRAMPGWGTRGAMTQTGEPVPSAYPQTKVTAADWLDLALRTLIEEGVDHVRILPLAQRLGVSRSSFYWYFESRDDLLNRLLQVWQDRNTRGIVDHAGRETATIAQALLVLFECWIDEAVFDPRLDFAIREWARRSPEVMGVVQRSDEDRVEAITAMFARHGFGHEDAVVRARIVYYMQIGYYALEIREPMKMRLARLRAYVRNITGLEPDDRDVRRFLRRTAEAERRRKQQARG